MIDPAPSREAFDARCPRRADGLVTRRILDETLVVPIRGTVAELDGIYALSGTAALIWESLDGRTSPEEILGRILKCYDAPAATIATDLREFVAELAAAGLIIEGT